MSKQDKTALAVGAAEIRKAETELENPRLTHLETVIKRGLQPFMDVGAALLEIRDMRLYKPKYKTFDLYCRERWKFNRAHAYRLIESSRIVRNLSPIGDIQPKTESQARPLTGLPKKTQRKVWKEAVQSANGKHPTARQVTAARERAKRIARHAPPPYEPKADEQKALDAIEKRAKKLAEIITPTTTRVALKLDATEKQRWQEIFAPIAAFRDSLRLVGIDKSTVIG